MLPQSRTMLPHAQEQAMLPQSRTMLRQAGEQAMVPLPGFISGAKTGSYRGRFARLVWCQSLTGPLMGLLTGPLTGPQSLTGPLTGPLMGPQSRVQAMQAGRLVKYSISNIFASFPL